MKYISEITGKTYNTADECIEAEKAFAETKKTESQRKKELCAKIDEAEKLISEAHEKDKVVREEVRKEFEALKAKLQESRKAIDDAELKKYEAVSEFVKEFGPYKKTFTGEEAIKEYNKSVKFWQDAFDVFYRDFPFLF